MTKRRTAVAVTFLIYVACIPAANLLIVHYGPVPVGFGLMAPAGVFAAGVAFTARDFLQRSAGKAWAVLAILAGTVISLLVADPPARAGQCRRVRGVRAGGHGRVHSPGRANLSGCRADQ